MNQKPYTFKTILVVCLIGFWLKPNQGKSQNFHTKIDEARDCYYVIYFSQDWKPLLLQEGQVLSGGDYKWIGKNDPAFQYIFNDFDTAYYYRFIYLKRNEVKNYISKKQTSVSENKSMADYYTIYVNGKGPISSSKQFEAQRCTFLGLNSKGLDTINTEGTRFWLDKNGSCTKQEYYRTYKNYELLSDVYYNNDDCEKQDRGYSYSWRKDGKEILFVFNSKMQKAVFLRRPDSDTCLAAYFIIKNNYTTYEPSIHWVVGDFQYLVERYFGGDPVQGSGNSDVTGNYLKSYWRDYQETLFFPFKYKSDWQTLDPDISKWFKLPEVDKAVLTQYWNDPSTNKAIRNIATELGREYLNDGGYWSAKFSNSGKDCNTYFYEQIY